MNGQMMSYDKYYMALKDMPQPVPFIELPKVKMDFRAILKYAKEKNLNPNDLSMEEREKFVTHM